MIVVVRGWWQHLRTRWRHRQDIRAFQQLMDAREARPPRGERYDGGD